MLLLVPLILVLGISDSVHVVRRVLEEEGDVASALRAVAPACLLTTVTTAVGFASLGITEAPTLRGFGGFGVLGLLAAWCTAMAGALPISATACP